MKQRNKVRMFASYHPKVGINDFWVRSRAKDIRGVPGTNENNWWKKCVKRGWRIVPVTVTLEKPVRK